MEVLCSTHVTKLRHSIPVTETLWCFQKIVLHCITDSLHEVQKHLHLLWHLEAFLAIYIHCTFIINVH